MDWIWILLLLVVVGGIAALAIWRPTQVTILEYERGLRYRGGRYVAQLAPGRHWHSGRSGRITKVDVRPTILTVPGQELLTADAIGVKVSLLATIQISDPPAAINKVQNYAQVVYSALQVGLRDEIGAITIEALLGDRSSIGKKLLERAAPAIAEAGVTLSSVDMRDVMLPGDLKRVFAQEVAARKEGAAALEKARGETAALRNLANAARMIQDNPALYQLRLLQQLGASGGNTVVLGQGDAIPIRTPDRTRDGKRAADKPEEPT